MDTQSLPTVVLTSGEPAGIGPDIVLAVAQRNLACRLIVVGDVELLRERAEQLGLSVTLSEISDPAKAPQHSLGVLSVVHCPLNSRCTPGQLDADNSSHVIDTLATAADITRNHQNCALITAPVQKSIICDAGIQFSGHTEFFARRYDAKVAMMLVVNDFRVALATTHLPLRAVPDAINQRDLEELIGIVVKGLEDNYGIETPTIAVLGLNPHAGEGGHLGREEIEVISPVCERLRLSGVNVLGPLPADTAFNSDIESQADTFLAMYHDQGLPVLKARGFGGAVNVTLGLPFIRTSVDHGTALELAGTGKAKPDSLFCAIDEALRALKATDR
ncbi:MAG: 4-hydroxythreonine-4-phosphate dehydrogenase PdxA [Luminiphilus sp.]|nr:4-hydroxythreonine-4-phosphate dehydrogenase PdxA [Luminiphilus sp.]